MRTDSFKPKIVVICGPTASGKTAASIDLAKAFGGEIVGADSVQIYKYMDIGTAKPTPNERSEVAHHMIDIVAPDEPFDVKQYVTMAREKIADLHNRGTIPFVVGGTGFYIKALLHGLFRVVPTDSNVRLRLTREAEIHGTEILYQRLTRLDPATAERIHPNDRYRIVRSLEVYELTGEKISELHKEHGFKDTRFNVLKIGLDVDRELLYDRINQRVQSMIEAGLVAEVQGLIAKGYTTDLKSMQAIGYRHMMEYLEGRCSWEEALRTLKRDTRRYAKRQLTWFKADSEIVWMAPRQIEDIRRSARKFLQDT